MNILGVMTKHWTPGLVKTRLAAERGEVWASQIHKAFVECLLQRLQQTADQRWLVFTPEGKRADFEQLVPSADFRLVCQATGHLGQRMQAYFEQAFAAGADRVVLIGSDSPTLPLEWIDQAFHALQADDVVLGPAEDGGYYLVGARNSVPPIFGEMPYSSPQLWTATVDKLQAAHISFACLPTWYDVDETPNLQRLWQELATDEPTEAACSILKEKLHQLINSPFA